MMASKRYALTGFFIGTCLLLLFATAAAQAEEPARLPQLGDATGERRIALVIGNANYQNSPKISVPANDANAMTKALQACDFDVTLEMNATQQRLDAAIHQFIDKITGANVAVLFYAGHAFQYNDTNYLVPVDANLTGEQDIETRCVDAGLILGRMEGADTQLNIFFIDAAWMDPHTKSWRPDESLGLAQMEAPPGTVIIGATGPGRLPNDDVELVHSPLVATVVRQMTKEGLSIADLHKLIGGEIAEKTTGAVRPWMTSDYYGYFVFAPRSTYMKGLESARAGQHAEAFAHFNKAAEMGDPRGMTSVGHLYETGRGVERDYAKAVEWYRKAADEGDPGGMESLATMYDNGWGIRQDFQQAAAWYRRAAEAGNSDAMNNLGVMYRKGLGVSQDSDQAMDWFLRADAVGNTSAMNNLGMMYQYGLGVEQNFDEAVKWYRKSASAGNPLGMNNLAAMFEKGKGVTKDLAMSAMWYRRSAQAGNARGMAYLAAKLEKGSGVEPDMREAIRLYKLAASQGDTFAKAALHRLKAD